MRFRSVFSVACAVALLMAPAAHAQYPVEERLCDVAYENCRTQLLDLINAETQSIDVAFWFMEDGRYRTALINRFNAGVSVRVLIDTQANTGHPVNEEIVNALADAGIPIREKTGGGILHWKTMIFGGQNLVEFSAANYSEPAFVPYTPHENYEDEVVFFATTPWIVDSFKTKFDDLWVSTSGYSDYANVTSRTRLHPTYEIDPDLNFPPGSGESYRNRAVARYDAETVGIDVTMYRITDQAHGDAMIDAVARGVPVRLYTEQEQYRDPSRLWHAWNVDRMYMAGVEVKHRAHQGLNHQKSVILRGQGMVIFGSSNWTTPSNNSQLEHNYFTTRSWIYDYFVHQFERKWNNTGPAPETTAFVPEPPDAPEYIAPANAAPNQGTTMTLKWYAGPWAHKYDIYFGTSSDPALLASDVELGPSERSSDSITYTIPYTLEDDTTYYWKVVSETMANLSAAGPVWSFRTTGGGGLPTAGEGDVVLYAYKAPVMTGNWSVVSDSTAAGGSRIWNPNAGLTKVDTPAVEPDDYFEMTFQAEAGIAYRIWVRGEAEGNSWANDSVWLQFSDSVDSSGAAMWRIGTTDGNWLGIENCSGCGLSNWGWNDNGYGGLGPLVYFTSGGEHTIRVQRREDGISIDQIILSRAMFIEAAPGAAKDDATIYAEQGGPGGEPPPAAPEIVLHTVDATVIQGEWSLESEATAASGSKMRNPDAGLAKVSTALASPVDYFELTFAAEAGVPYRLWMRSQAQDDHYNNDSVHVQFSGSVDGSGSAVNRIGTTASAVVALQEDSGAPLAAWGWQDNGWGTGVLGPEIYFETAGTQTIRIQRREDGMSIDQIVLSPSTYLTSSPGSLTDDSTILTKTQP